MKYEYGQQWDLVATDAKNFFTSWTPSMIKWIVGIHHYGERIKCAHKSNTTAACPVCGEIEDLDHFLLCENNGNKREE